MSPTLAWPQALARALLCLVALLVVGACRDALRAADRSVNAGDRGTNVGDPRVPLDSLRAGGRWPEALAVALARQRALEAIPGTPRWRLEDARREVAVVRRVATAPESLRAAFAAGDAAFARAALLLEGGDASGARALLEPPLAIRRRLLGSRDPEVARTLSALARAALAAHDVRRAHDLDREALDIRLAAFGERHPETAESLDRLGLDYKTAGMSRAENLRLYRRALAVRRDLLGPEAPETIESLTHLANLFRVTRQPDSALAVFRHVIAVHERLGQRAERAEAQFAMAMTLTPLGRWDEAERLLRDAAGVQRSLGPPAQLALARSLGAHGLSLRHLGRLAEAELALSESAARFEALRAGVAPGPTRPGWFSLVSHRELAAVQLEQGRGDAAWPSLERSLGRSVLEDLAAHAALDTSGWWDEPLARVQRELPRDGAVVGWLAVRPGAAAEEYPFWCYVIRRDGPVHWARVDRPEQDAAREADVAVDRLRTELLRLGAWPLHVSDPREIRALGRAVYDQRFAPMEPWLEGVRKLVVIAPDLLHGVPAELMVDSRGAWLSDRFSITYAPSALLDARSRSGARGRAPAAWRALLVGNSDPSRSGALQALPAAGSEVRAIAARIEDATVLEGVEASRERLEALARSGELSRFELLHFATHAAVDHVWFGRSALVLAAGPGNDARDGGRLPSEEIAAGWNLGAELVTLAGCGTVFGPGSTTEGYLGLHQALLGAGARRVVASLWPVDDGATALLMNAFYERLLDPAFEPGGATPDREALALADARRRVREYRAPDGSRPWAHPLYWAGMVLFSGGSGAPRVGPA